jgi:hypothetical protein
MHALQVVFKSARVLVVASILVMSNLVLGGQVTVRAGCMVGDGFGGVYSEIWDEGTYCQELRTCLAAFCYCGGEDNACEGQPLCGGQCG